MPKILVVDDLNSILVKAKRVLEDGGYQVETANSWAQAIKHLGAVDLVLMDYNLGAFDGGSICELVKGSYPDLKVYMYSTVADDRVREIVEEAGADGMITGKGDDRMLLAQVQSIVPV